MDLEGLLETDIVGDSEETIDDIVEDSIEAIDDIAEDPVEIAEDILDSGVEDLAAENDSNDDEISLTNEEIVVAKETLSEDVFSDYFEDPELFSKYSEYEYQPLWEGQYF